MKSILLFFKSFFLFFTIISNTQSYAQESSQTCSETVDLSFNDSFNYFLDDDVKWNIWNNEGLFVKVVSGTISNLQFEQPRVYSIKIQESKNHNHNKCDHAHFPSSIELKVSPYSLVLDFNLLYYSHLFFYSA